MKIYEEQKGMKIRTSRKAIRKPLALLPCSWKITNPISYGMSYPVNKVGELTKKYLLTSCQMRLSFILASLAHNASTLPPVSSTLKFVLIRLVHKQNCLNNVGSLTDSQQQHLFFHLCPVKSPYVFQYSEQFIISSVDLYWMFVLNKRTYCCLIGDSRCMKMISNNA